MSSPEDDAPSWPPHFFDLADPDGPGEPPAAIIPIIIDYLAHETSHTPDWRIDKDGPVRLSRIVRLSVISKAEGEARIGFVSGAVEGAISLSCDPSGWLLVKVSMGGAEVFRGWFDQPYEEYELWPSGARERTIDPPGRMGKRRNWLSLNTKAWPMLRPLANEGGFLNLQALDYVTIHVRLLNESTDVWRPVKAATVAFAFELLAPEDYDPETETWEFPPGSNVRCEMRTLADGPAVVAVALADDTRP